MDKIISNQHLLSALLKNSPSSIMVFDRQGLCLFTNTTGLSMMELTETSVKGKPFSDIWPDDQQSTIDSYVQKALEGVSGMFDTYQMKGSRKWWWRVSLSPLCGDNGSVEGLLAISTDITGSREAEENLKSLNEQLGQEIASRSRALRQTYNELLLIKEGLKFSEAELNATIENLPFELFGIDRNGTYFLQNRVCRNNWGTLIGKKPEEVAPDKETLRFWHDNNRRALAGEIVREEFETVVQGEKRYMYNILAPISIEGSIEGAVGFNIDVTELVQADTERKREEKKFSNLFESVNDPIFIIDLDGNFIDVNRTAYERLGYTREELLSMSIPQIDHPDFAVKIPERMQELKDHGTAFFESAHRKKDGTVMPVEVNAKVIEYEGRQVILSVIRDITERKRAEEELNQYRHHLEELVEERTRQLTVLNEQLRQSQKLEAIGLLAGGIAHDFSNVLAAIKGSLYLIQKKLPKDDPAMQYVNQVVSSISRANTLTQGLLAFGRQQMVVLKPRDVNWLVRDMATLVSQVTGEDITLSLMLSDKEPKALADKNQIEQVLLNLVTNARDAMPDGGTLTIQTDIIGMDESFKKEHGYGIPDRYVLIAVSDTGSGIDEDIREKIFEPFFTTKVAGKGSGLGLAVSYGIIKQHNGYISAESSRDRGTTFRIYIPAVDAEVTQTEARSASPAVSGIKTILFAEDDPDARTTTAEILRMTGYEVLEAKDGEEALRLFGEHKDRIHLVLLDVRMPGKNGREVYETIRNSGSDARCLFISGYTADIMDEAVISEKNVDFISKIVLPDEILRKIREILDR